MTLGLIWAESTEGFIGKNGKLPWNTHYADMEHFKTTTEGCTVIMGYRTMKSLGKPLPGRQNVVVYNREAGLPDGFDRVHPDDLDELLEFMGSSTLGLAWVIGGKALLERAEPHATVMYRSFINGNFGGDVLGPDLEWSGWPVDKVEVDVYDTWSLARYER